MAEDAPWLEAKADLPDAPWAAKPAPSPLPQSEQTDMPDAITALGQGVMHGAVPEVEQSLQTLRGEKPQASTEPPSPAAAPLEWSDLWHPLARGLPKIAYQTGESMPTLGAGLAGGVLGGLTPIPGGTIAGGAIGAAAGAAFQKIGPAFGEELKKTPNDPNGAYDRALAQATASGAFSGLGWAAFPVRFFQGPLKHIAFQAFGVQAPIAVGEQAVQNVIQGKPATEDLGRAYATGVAGTAVPMLGHAALARPERASPVPGQPQTPTLAPGTTPTYRQINMADPVPGEGPDVSRWSSLPFGKHLDKAIMGWKKNFQPEMVSDLSQGMEGIFRTYVGSSDQQRSAIVHEFEQLRRQFEPLPLQDKIDFIRGMGREEENGIPVQIPQGLQHYEPMVRQLMKMVYQQDKDAGSKMGYWQDYFPRQWTEPERANQFIQASQASMGAPQFQKKRTLKTLQEGLDMGLELKSYNPIDLLTNRILGSAEIKTKVGLLNDLNQAGAAAKLETPADVSSANYNGWHIVKDPVGQQWAIHPDLKPMWDNVVAAGGLWENPTLAGNLFRGWMGMKNWYVPIKLAASLFHPLHVAHININDALSRGWTQLTQAKDPLGALNTVARGFYGMVAQGIPGLPTEAKAARAAWLTPEWKQTPEQKALVKMMVEGGFSPQLSEQLRIKDSKAFSDAWANSEYHKILLPAGKEFVRKTQGLIFEHWIPSLKTAAYLDGARELFQRRPDLLDNDQLRKTALATIAKSVDNRYGEMFYRGLFWNKTLKDAGIGSFLSLGWNLGFLREFGGGTLEPLLGKAIDNPTRDAIAAAKSKTSFAFMYMTSAMILNALTTKMMSGSDPEYMDYFLPRIGGINPDGSPRRITNMFYSREVPMLQKHIEEQQSAVGGVAQMLWNKMMFEPFHEYWTNKDYYGFEISDPSAPFYQRVGQFAKYVGSDMFNPITITGAKRSLIDAGKWNDNDSVQQKAWKIFSEPEGQRALMGFGPAPSYASKSSTVNRLTFMYHQYVSPEARPYGEKENVEARMEARKRMAVAQRQGDSATAAEAAQKLQELGASKKVKEGTQDLYMFQRLPWSAQKQFLSELGPTDFKRYYPKANKKMVKGDPAIIDLVKKYYQ
jgi:hypothetical protein